MARRSVWVQMQREAERHRREAEQTARALERERQRQAREAARQRAYDAASSATSPARSTPPYATTSKPSPPPLDIYRNVTGWLSIPRMVLNPPDGPGLCDIHDDIRAGSAERSQTPASVAQSNRHQPVRAGACTSSQACASSRADDVPAFGEYGVSWLARREPCRRTGAGICRPRRSRGSLCPGAAASRARPTSLGVGGRRLRDSAAR